MTISTTRSRIRTIGSATLAATVGLGMGALTIAAAPAASAAAVDAMINYNCTITNADANGDGSIDIEALPVPGLVAARTRTTIPETVAAGATIPETAVQIDIDLSVVAGITKATFGDFAKGNSTNTEVHFGINGVDQSATLQNLQADWMPVPATGQWLIPVAGTVPPVNVPADASGTITVDGPAAFTINAFHNDTGVDPHAGTSHLECTVNDANELRLGTIQVAGTDASQPTTLTGTAATSAVNTDAVVALSVAPVAPGTVTLSYDGKDVGTTTLANGAGSITIPAATLPTAGTFKLLASYSGAPGFLGDDADVTVVRTAVEVDTPADPAKAKIKAKAKPKKLKIGKKGKVKIKIKSDSTDMAGKIKIKIKYKNAKGKKKNKTLGKGKVNEAGKGTIKLKTIKAEYLKKGKIKLSIKYGGNDSTEKAKKNLKVKVKK